MKKKITEMKNSLEEPNSRTTKVEEQISHQENGMMKILKRTEKKRKE